MIKREKLIFDFIHAHFTWPSGAVAAALKKRFNVPLIITEHTSVSFYKAAEIKDICWTRTLNVADAIIRVREGDSHLFSELDVPLEKVYAIPNGFDANKFFQQSSVDCRKKLDLPNDRKILLNVGNPYDPVKGHRYFIEAIGLIVQTRQDVCGIIVGSGKLEADLRDLIKERHLEKFVRLVGGRPHGEIPLWMNACDLFVLPSLNEGNPTVMFEAIGCGKPFIGTKVGGVPDVINSDEYGLLVEPGNASRLADIMITALMREWDSKKISEYAERYAWMHIAQAILNVYLDTARSAKHMGK